jgi:thiol-disulfide isomerase/thioredoxin
MAKKSISNSLSSLLNVDFEVVLIITLIVVAILLVVFFNRKFSKEQFLMRKIRAAKRMEHFQSNSEPEHQNMPNVSPETKVYFFYATWCGYSKKYLDDKYPDLKNKLKSNNLENRFVDCDVETNEGKELASAAGVTGLPSFYQYENGEYTKMSFSNGIDNDQIISWLLEN